MSVRVGFVTVEIMHWFATKVLQALVVVAMLNAGVVFSLKAFPFKIRKVSKDTFYEGPQPRIFGGLEAPESKFPFMIFVMMKLVEETKSQCSASLVKTNWVLLAAHCVSFPGLQADNIIAAGGRADLAEYIREKLRNGFHTPIDESRFGVQERKALAYFAHPKYNGKDLKHDVALIKLKEPFVLNSISLIPLSENKMEQRKICTILGWGLTAGNQQTFKLNYAEEKWVSTTALGCKNKPEGPFICLVPDSRRICQGDSGSPLVCDGKVWGVASHFVSYNPNPDCGDSVEDYYSDIYADLDWIHSTYNSGNMCSNISVRTVLVCVFAGLLLSAKVEIPV